MIILSLSYSVNLVLYLTNYLQESPTLNEDLNLEFIIINIIVSIISIIFVRYRLKKADIKEIRIILICFFIFYTQKYLINAINLGTGTEQINKNKYYLR